MDIGRYGEVSQRSVLFSFSYSLNATSLFVCLFVLILVPLKLTVLLIISEQVQGQYLSSGKAAALASAFPRRAGTYETSHGGQ